MKSPHSLYKRLAWHPVVVLVPLTFWIFKIYSTEFSTFRIIGLLVVTLWFAISVYDLFSKHKALDWMYPED